MDYEEIYNPVTLFNCFVDKYIASKFDDKIILDKRPTGVI